MSILNLSLRACDHFKFKTGIDYNLNYRSSDDRIIVTIGNRQYSNIDPIQEAELLAFIQDYLSGCKAIMKTNRPNRSLDLFRNLKNKIQLNPWDLTLSDHVDSEQF